MFELEGYETREVLHEGHRSRVFRGVRRRDGRGVVVKLPAQPDAGAAGASRTRREFELGSSVTGPGTIEYLGLEACSAGLALVMDDFGGRALRAAIPERGYPLARFLDLAIDLAGRLAQVHAANILHLDVKPSNVILDPRDGSLRLCDFDLSRRADDVEALAQHRFEGTLGYISPEQTGRINRQVDHRSDLYSLGVTLYQLLTGALPFESDDAMVLVHAHIARRPPSPRDARPDVPEAVAAIVLKLLAKNAGDRYAGTRGLRLDLERCRRELAETGAISRFEPGAHDASGRLLFPDRFHGRDEERRALLGAFDRAATGRAEVVLIRGFSGVGKSALVEQLRRPILERRGSFASGKFDQLTRNVPYSAIIAAVRALIREILTEDDARVQAWRARIVGAVGVNGQLLVDVIPELALIVGPQPPLAPLGPAEGQARFRWVSIDFIAALASEGHPAVLFLDDLQWADDASLRLLEALFTEAAARHLLVLGAYRDNEVDAAHLLTAVRASIARVRPVGEVALEPLGRPDVGAMIDEVLHAPPGGAADLADLTFEKTGGNPFFVREFLKATHDEALLVFDVERERWRWDVARIEAKGFTDNVVELTVAGIRRLDADAQAALSLAACVGNRFGLDTLAIVAEAEPARVAAHLREALRRGLIVPEGAALAGGAGAPQDPGAEVAFRFLHDRVQQAAYSLIPDARRARIHFTIGRLLLARSSPRQREERAFEIVNHLNYGIDLASSAAERLELCALNRAAGRNAKDSGAYVAAAGYHAKAFRLLGDDPWEEHYALALEVRHDHAEAAYLAGRFDEMAPVLGEVLARARTHLERVPAYLVKMLAHTARNQMAETLDTAREVLAYLGVTIPRRPGRAETLLGLARTQWLLRGRTHEALLALPTMRDPAALAAMRVLANAATAAYLAGPDVFPFFVFQMLRLSLVHGNCRQSIHAYSTWSVILAAVLGDVDGAETYDAAALGLVDRLDAADFRCKSQIVHAVFIHHRKRAIRDTLDGFLAGYRTGVATGDPETAALHLTGYHWTMAVAGFPLAELARSFDDYLESVRRCDVKHCSAEMLLGRQFVRNLMGEARDSRALAGPDVEEGAFLEEQTAAKVRAEVALCGHLQGWIALFHRDFARACERFEFAGRYMDALVGTTTEPEFHLLQGLARAQAHPALPPGARRENLRGLARNLKTLRAWAAHGPMNHAHKALLLEAEGHRIAGRVVEAMRAYEESARLARRHRFVHEEALAHEHAGRFHLSIGNDVAGRAHLREARDCYAAWGSGLKVRLLDEEFGERLAPPRRALMAPSEPPAAPDAARGAALAGSSVTDESSDTSLSLDLSTLFKSSRAMAEEIVLDALLRKLLRMLIENAGAERGFLILADGGRLLIELEADAGAAEPRALGGVAPDDALGLSTAIINYAARTRESVVLRDAAAEGAFVNDPYVARSRPRSVLCAPLVKRGQLEALVYMENNLTAGAFTKSRLEVLHLLTSQAALSIHNARLYEELERALSGQVRLAEAQARFVPQEFLEGLSRRTIVDVTLGEHVRREMSILFSDIKGFTSLIEAMPPDDHVPFINEYLSFMEPALLEHGGFVDSYVGDAIMALFLGGADDAVRAGVAMRAGLERLNEARARRGAPPVAMGVGVSTGMLTMGTIGGPQRIKCGVIGDPVNLASRVESLTRRWGSFLLVSHYTRERLADPSPYALREVGRVVVLGRATPVTLYEVLAAEPAPVRDARLRTLGRYAEGLDAFYGRRFAEASSCFEACVRGEPGDRPAALLLERAARLARDGCPDGWTGVETLEGK